MNPHRIVDSEKLLARWVDNPCSSRFPLYTGYLQSLASGERLNAVHRYLRPLIAELVSQSHAARFELIDSLCRAFDYRARVAGTSPVPGLPHELLEQIAIPTLLEHMRAHPGDAYTQVWLAMLPVRHPIPDLPNPRELLFQAYRLAPNDQFIVERIADEHLHSIQFACHHLPSYLLAPADAVLEELGTLRQLALCLSEERRSHFSAEADRHACALEQFVQSHIHIDST